MSAEKYRMFKQFMHNELGITKEDIREWITEAVRQEVEKMVAKSYGDFDVSREIRDVIHSPHSTIRREIANAVAVEICKHVKLAVDIPYKEDTK